MIKLDVMKIIFICHGNICRSPVAEILLNELIKENGLENKVNCVSRSTSLEEIGNDIYPPMKRILFNHGVEFNRHYATRITEEEFEKADYIFYMDRNNLNNLERLFGKSNKFHLISEFSDNNEVEDPWYTGRFEYVFYQIEKYVSEIYKKVIV